jgi:hypothetical protein
MSVYSKILEKIINTDVTIQHTLVKQIFTVFLNEKQTNTNKFSFFKKTVETDFIKNFHEKEFIDCFCKIQKIYNTLNKFFYNYKFNKTKIVGDTDMGLNKLNENSPNIICLLQNNSKYLFKINDLIQIINCALTNSNAFFSKPLCIKNPFNNLPFNKSTLYNIYFFVKFKTHIFSEIFFKFFKCNFNISFFKETNEYFLREQTIYNFVYKSTSDLLVKEIKKMIRWFNQSHTTHKIDINVDFPKNVLIKIFKPYLLLYVTSQNAFLTHSKNEALIILNKKLTQFNIFNPQFGRKRYKIIKTSVCQKDVIFDTNYVQFNTNFKMQNNNFLSDHLKFVERNIYDDTMSIPFVDNLTTPLLTSLFSSVIPQRSSLIHINDPPITVGRYIMERDRHIDTPTIPGARQHVEIIDTPPITVNTVTVPRHVASIHRNGDLYVRPVDQQGNELNTNTLRRQLSGGRISGIRRLNLFNEIMNSVIGRDNTSINITDPRTLGNLVYEDDDTNDEDDDTDNENNDTNNEDNDTDDEDNDTDDENNANDRDSYLIHDETNRYYEETNDDNSLS